ncbi:MAG: LytR C-terminal domain-containing protein [Acidimicrobiia bacterium]
MSSRRRWQVAALLVAVLASGFLLRSRLADAGGAVWDVVAGWSTRLRDLGEAEPSTEVGLRSREGESASVLLVLGSGEEDAAFALLVADPSGPPLLVVLPQDLLLAVPGFGEFRLVDALIFGGPDLAALAVTNQFGIRIDGVSALPAGSIARAGTGSVAVELSAPLFVEAADGSVSRVVPDGITEVDSDQLEALLVTEGAGDGFEWLQRQAGVWRAILDSVAADPGVADRITAAGGAGAADAADLLVTVAADPEALIATVPVLGAQSVTGVDALFPAGNQADDFVRQRLGHLLLRPEGRPRIEILNGNGRIGTTASVATILVRDGYRLIRTDNADHFDYEETLVVAQGDQAEQAARDIVDILGRGLLFLEVQAPSGVVDVSIIVGHDIPSGEG